MFIWFSVIIRHIYYIILLRIGIFEKRFDKKPDPIISFFETNLLFLPLQMLHVDFNIYLLFFVMKALTFKSLVSFLHYI